jgi:hypothetical protein
VAHAIRASRATAGDATCRRPRCAFRPPLLHQVENARAEGERGRRRRRAARRRRARGTHTLRSAGGNGCTPPLRRRRRNVSPKASGRHDGAQGEERRRGAGTRENTATSSTRQERQRLAQAGRGHVAHGQGPHHQRRARARRVRTPRSQCSNRPRQLVPAGDAGEGRNGRGQVEHRSDAQLRSRPSIPLSAERQAEAAERTVLARDAHQQRVDRLRLGVRSSASRSESSSWPMTSARRPPGSVALTGRRECSRTPVLRADRGAQLGDEAARRGRGLAPPVFRSRLEVRPARPLAGAKNPHASGTSTTFKSIVLARRLGADRRDHVGFALRRVGDRSARQVAIAIGARCQTRRSAAARSTNRGDASDAITVTTANAARHASAFCSAAARHRGRASASVETQEETGASASPGSYQMPQAPEHRGVLKTGNAARQVRAGSSELGALDVLAAQPVGVLEARDADPILLGDLGQGVALGDPMRGWRRVRELARRVSRPPRRDARQTP